MKKLLLMIFLVSGFAQAQLINPILQAAAHGGEAGGGGDDCENRIQLIADDIKSWIKQGGSSYLKFESDLNTETYNSKMLNILNIVSSNELVSNVVECTSEKIYVDGTEKTCRWEKSQEVSEQGFKIFCNYDRFMNGISDEDKKLEKEDAQYQLVHHEIAGVAGVEGSYKDRSRYNLSNQAVISFRNVEIEKIFALKDIKFDRKFHKFKDFDEVIIQGGNFKIFNPNEENSEINFRKPLCFISVGNNFNSGKGIIKGSKLIISSLEIKFSTILYGDEFYTENTTYINSKKPIIEISADSHSPEDDGSLYLRCHNLINNNKLKRDLNNVFENILKIE